MRGGGRARPDARRALLDAHTACVEKNQPNPLFELNLEGPRFGMLKIYDVFPIGHRRDEVEEDRVCRLRAGPEAKFAETVATNRGVNVRIFPDAEAADLADGS
jgi:hypothetical protein